VLWQIRLSGLLVALKLYAYVCGTCISYGRSGLLVALYVCVCGACAKRTAACADFRIVGDIFTNDPRTHALYTYVCATVYV
jgi:hypothetical protein